MSRPRLPETGPGPVPCAGYQGALGGRYVHPEGVCGCFWGGTAPVWVPAPEISVLANHPGVFHTSWIGQAGGWRHHKVARGRVRAWLRRTLGS